MQNAIDAGADLKELINDGMIGAMDVVGQKYSRNEIYVPEMLVAAVTMKKGIDLINPLFERGCQRVPGYDHNVHGEGRYP